MIGCLALAFDGLLLELLNLGLSECSLLSLAVEALNCGRESALHVERRLPAVLNRYLSQRSIFSISLVALNSLALEHLNHKMGVIESMLQAEGFFGIQRT